MRLIAFITLTAMIGLSTTASAQIKRTSVPIGDAVSKALAKMQLTGGEARPFHIKISISEPENGQSPYQGSIEEWWASPEQWRREVTAKGGMKQTVVTVAGKKTERDEGDYFPLWLRSFVTGAFDPIPNAAAWTASGITIDQITMPNAKSDACARAKSQIGTGDRATDAFSNVCFDSEGRLKFYGSPRYAMGFSEYRAFGKKQIAWKLTDSPEPGTTLVGEVMVLEDLSKSASADTFVALPTDDGRFRSAEVNSTTIESLSAGNESVVWPPVHSGNVRGHLAMYISADAEGQVREAWPLNSDNAGLNDAAREQVMRWRLKAATDASGKRLQVDGGLGFAFQTAIGDLLPVLTDAEARELASHVVEPELPAGTLSAGTRYPLRISVNEQGMVTGSGTGDVEIPGTVKAPAAAFFAAMNAVKGWKFKPLIRDGKPCYFQADLVFVAK